ncbi:ABC transporter permease [Amycolatopsis alkalitolerans]|uniref:ABC transporter permease n=1 Tax=Amycolatopsis alkalitolerans TaxID=2547244 RepID=A0A5C4M0A9_9PSEU|nr:ABC transporter permease [Amycolatopsis alkalitolerans]TNC25728.1 ABC transporter permease [Amycolatopsis alkalitolerans]
MSTTQALEIEEVIDTASIRQAARRRFTRGLWRRAVSVVLLLLIWQIVSLFMDESVVPQPWAVFGQMGHNLGEGDTYHQLGVTMIRVVGGMAIAVFAGISIGLMMGLSKLGEDLLDTWVLIAFTIPAIVYGILCILWFGLNDLAAVLAVGIGATPAIAINIWQGTKAIDRDLIHMGKAFRFSRRSVLLRVVVPQLIPYILAALRYALGLSWKIVTIVELLGLSSGVGYTLNYWFGNFNMVQVLAWTLLFTVALLIAEFAILKPIEARLTRWRPAAQFQRGA